MLPETPGDRENIERFVAARPGKPVVAVQGLGFVGAVMAMVCANALSEDYTVVGVDLPSESTYWKIQSLNEGIFPLVAEDPKIEEFYRKALKKNSFYATYDEYAYSIADVIIVDVNLDVQKKSSPFKDLDGYDVDLKAFSKAVEAIGRNCKEDVLILVETTVPPGTCQNIVHPILQNCLEHRGLATDSFKLGHSFERVMPGPQYIDSIQNFYRVYAGIDGKSADATEKFLRTIIRTDQYPLTRLGNVNASEMAKVLENSYRAMNIALIVEWSRFAEEAGVNLFEVVQSIRMRPTHSNMMLPGIGVGGYCLTKDPLLASWARQHMFSGGDSLSQSEMAVRINDKMPQYAFTFFQQQFQKKLQGKKILLLGVSYRGEVGDTRHTPVELLYDCFVNAGSEVYLHDPHVRFWVEKGLEVGDNLAKQLAHRPDVVVISTGHLIYKKPECIEALLDLPRAYIYDTLGILSDDQITKLRKKHTVKVLGRGDL